MEYDGIKIAELGSIVAIKKLKPKLIEVDNS